MKSLTTLATNPFPSALMHCSYENGVKFLDDTVNRFTANNPGGIYTTILNTLKANVVIYKSGVVQLQKGYQKSATSTVDKNFETFLDTGRRLYNKIEDVFGLHTSKLMEFFPTGKTGMNNANRGYIVTLIQLWNNVAISKYSTQLGPDWLTELAALLVTWNTGVKDQSGEKSTVKTGVVISDDITQTVGENLWNLFLLVVQNNQPNAENVIGTYFDITPLKRKTHSDTDGLGRCLGIVKNTEGGDIAAVTVSVLNSENVLVWTGATNKTGNFRTTNLPIGMYHVRFDKETYVSQTISYEVQDAEDISVTVVLVSSILP